MKTSAINKIVKSALCAFAVAGLAAETQAQTPFYSVNGIGGTGGGSSSISVTPSIAPSGSSSLTDLGATANLSFGTGPDGVAGESLVNAATGQAGAQVLAGTLGASSSLSAFTVTMWINANTATANNYRILEISPGSPATTGSADGTSLFLGLNASGDGVQFYANNVNPGNATDIAGYNNGTTGNTAAIWNNNSSAGTLAANTWYFIALTYDTVGGNSLLYTGSQNTSASLAYTYANSTDGNLNLSSATSIALLDRFSNGRNFPGAIDDVNLYSGALTPTQIDAIQAAQAVPEPGTLTLLGIGSCVGIMAIRRRRS